MRLRSLFMALVLFTGCGARSALEATIAGAGGGTAASSSAAGSGGSGGSEPRCHAWKVTATWFGGAGEGNTLFAPHLVAASDTANSAALVFVAASAGTIVSQVWHGGLTPWGAPVPSGIPLVLYQTVDIIAPDVATSPGQLDGTHALSVTTPDGAGTQVFSTVPSGADAGPSVTFLPAAPGIARPLFLAQRRTLPPDPTTELLQGIEQAASGRRRLKVRLLSDHWGNVLHGQSVACGDDDLAAAASGWQSEFLLAASSSRPLGKCDDDADPLGSPSEVQVSFYHLPLGQVIQPILSLKAEARVDSINVFPAGADPAVDGAWVVFSAAGMDGERHVHAARFDPAGKILSPPFEVAKTASMGTGLTAAARLGTNLAVAWGALDGMDQVIKIGIFDRGGALSQSFEIVPMSGGRVALLGSPDGQQLLVAVTEGDGTAHLVRYSCTGAP